MVLRCCLLGHCPKRTNKNKPHEYSHLQEIKSKYTDNKKAPNYLNAFIYFKIYFASLKRFVTSFQLITLKNASI